MRQEFIVGDMGRTRQEVQYAFVNTNGKIVTGDVVILMLVKYLEAKEVGGRRRACSGAFKFPPHAGEIVRLREGCSLTDVKAAHYSVIVEDTTGEL